MIHLLYRKYFRYMANEKKTDILIARLLREAGIDAEPNSSRIKEVQEALATSSKRGTGKQGFPEFTAQVGEFIIVIEDKAENERRAKYISPGSEVLLMDNSSIVNYAENAVGSKLNNRFIIKVA